MTDHTRPGRPREPHLSDVTTGQFRTSAALGLDAAGHTDKGRVRTGNEDAYAVEQPTSSQARAHGTLLVVADGMGGHAAGEVASQLAVETIQAAFYQAPGTTASEGIHDAIVAANTAIYEGGQQNAAHAGMGCTIVAMVVQGAELTVGHVGDSRGYLIRGGQAKQITRDHSWVAMQVEEGVLTPEQAERHPNRSMLMRALGRHPDVEVELSQHRLQAGDVILICSDGLTNVVKDAEIGEYAGRLTPAAIAEQLVGLANQRGAPDNVTVVAATVTDAAASPAPAANPVPAFNPDSTVIMPPSPAQTVRLGEPLSGSVQLGDPSTGKVRLGEPSTGKVRLGEPSTGTVRLGEPTATPSAERAQPRAAPAAAPQRPRTGAPVVVVRGSVIQPEPGLFGGRLRGRGKLLAGVGAALGVALGLILLTTLRSEPASSSAAGRVATGVPPAAAATVTRSAAAPAGATATVPPPIATGLPLLPAPAAASPISADSSGTGAGSQAPVAATPNQQPKPAQTAVASPAATVPPTAVPTTAPTQAPTSTPTPIAAAPEAAPADAAAPGEPVDAADPSEPALGDAARDASVAEGDAPAPDADAPATEESPDSSASLPPVGGPTNATVPSAQSPFAPFLTPQPGGGFPSLIPPTIRFPKPKRDDDD